MKKKLYVSLSDGLVALACFALVTKVAAQGPEPVPNVNRAVHPAIADALPAIQPFLTPSPLFAVDDGIWNHGEGFGGAGVDVGGWHSNDDGSGLMDNHVHTYKEWDAYQWNNPLPPFGSVPTLRYVGYLRPQSIQQSPPGNHPLYGAVGPYVDQGAFELFVPAMVPLGTRKILLCVMTRETVSFPADFDDVKRQWRTVYRGIFSPDGLVRDEETRLS